MASSVIFSRIKTLDLEDFENGQQKNKTKMATIRYECQHQWQAAATLMVVACCVNGCNSARSSFAFHYWCVYESSLRVNLRHAKNKTVFRVFAMKNYQDEISRPSTVSDCHSHLFFLRNHQKFVHDNTACECCL